MTLIRPHGGSLKGRSGPARGRTVTVSQTALADAEMIGIGAYSPLEGFMGAAAARSVLERMRLPDGILWSIPIMLPIDAQIAAELRRGETISLAGEDGVARATVTVRDVFSFDAASAAERLFGSSDREHPGVARFIGEFEGKRCVSGPVERVRAPSHYGIAESYFLEPRQTRARFEANGWSDVVAFQTRNPIHRAHEYLIKAALEPADGVLIHPLVGPTKPDDIPADVRMRCYETLIEHYFDPERIVLSVLPAPMRYAGPREAIHHMIMRKNYGISSMIIGRDHAGVGDYYGTYDAQNLARELGPVLGMRVLPFQHSFYCTSCGEVVSEKTCPHPAKDHVHLSGTKVRAMLRSGKRPPKEFSRPEVAKILVDWAKKANGKPAKRR